MKVQKVLALVCILNLMGSSAQAITIPTAIITQEENLVAGDAALLSGWMTDQLKYAVPFNSTAGNVVPSQLKLFGFEVGAEGVVSGTKLDVDGLHSLPTSLINPQSINMFSRFPMPMVLGHAKIGLPFGFDAGIRIGGIPKTSENTGTTSGSINNKVFGLDLRKKVIEEGALKPFGLTVGLNYTHADGSLDVATPYTAQNQVIQGQTISMTNGVATEHADWKTNSVGLQAILDKKILIITPYIGASVNRNSGDINNAITAAGTANASILGTAVSQDLTATGSSTTSPNKWDVRALAGFELSILPFVKLGFGGEYAGNRNMAGDLGLRIQFR